MRDDPIVTGNGMEGVDQPRSTIIPPLPRLRATRVDVVKDIIETGHCRHFHCYRGLTEALEER